MITSAPEALIDLVPKAGLVPALWPKLLGEIGTHIGGNGGSIMRLSDGYVSAASSPNLEQTSEEFMRNGWAERDQAVKRGLALKHLGFSTTATCSPIERSKTTTFTPISIASTAWAIAPQPLSQSPMETLPGLCCIATRTMALSHPMSWLSRQHSPLSGSSVPDRKSAGFRVGARTSRHTAGSRIARRGVALARPNDG